MPSTGLLLGVAFLLGTGPGDLLDTVARQTSSTVVGVGVLPADATPRVEQWVWFFAGGLVCWSLVFGIGLVARLLLVAVERSRTRVHQFDNAYQEQYRARRMETLRRIRVIGSIPINALQGGAWRDGPPATRSACGARYACDCVRVGLCRDRRVCSGRFLRTSLHP